MTAEAASSKQLSPWIVAIAVLLTAGGTAWAAWMSGFRGPQTAWAQAESAVGQVWPQQGGAVPQTADPTGRPGASALPPGGPQAGAGSALGPARTVAGLPGVPTITWGAQRPHPDRGPCAGCHNVVKRDGKPVPIIQSFSVRPHEYRGVCSNCHSITVGGRPVAGTQLAPGGQLQPRAPREADWRGMEVRQADQGVVITKTEGVAARVGAQPGDVVESINGVRIQTTADFVDVTRNGNLQQGAVIARRNDQRLAFEIAPNPVAPPPGLGAIAPGAMGGAVAPVAPGPPAMAPAVPPTFAPGMPPAMTSPAMTPPVSPGAMGPGGRF